MGSNSDVSAFFRLRFRNGLGTKPAGVLPFRMRVPNTFFLSLAWWLAGFQVLRCAKVCLAWGNFFFVFNRFQKQRFGSFLAAVSHGLGTISFFLMGSKSDVSAFFQLRFGNGLGAKPAGVLPFRLRAPNTFFLCWPGGLQASKSYVALCLAGRNLSQPFFFVFSRFQKQRFGSFLAAVSHGLGTILLSF